MALIKNTCTRTNIIRNYLLPQVTNRESALLWIAHISKNSEIYVKRIEVDDFQSYHDGTTSTQFHSIESIDEFVNSYKASAIVDVGLIGEYKNHLFSLGINLDTGNIGFAYSKSEPVDYEALEQLFGLV